MMTSAIKDEERKINEETEKQGRILLLVAGIMLVSGGSSLLLAVPISNDAYVANGGETDGVNREQQQQQQQRLLLMIEMAVSISVGSLMILYAAKGMSLVFTR